MSYHNGGVGIDIEDTNDVVEGGGGGDETEGVGGHRDDAKAMASVGALQNEVVGVPEPDSLIIHVLHRFSPPNFILNCLACHKINL